MKVSIMMVDPNTNGRGIIEDLSGTTERQNGQETGDWTEKKKRCTNKMDMRDFVDESKTLDCTQTKDWRVRES